MAADDDAGALFQFVPVITSRHLASQRLALWALLGIEAGLGGMLCGFFGIGGTPVLAMALPADAAAVLLEVLGAAWNRAVPLVRARPLTLPGRMVLTGLVFLLVTVMLGLSLALALAVPALTPYLALLLNALGDHALAGLGGWLTRTAMGVSDKLLPMFMLSPEERGIPGDCLHILGTVGFALAVAAGVAQVWFAAGFLRIAQSTGSVAITIAVAIYLWDIGRIYRTRRRSAIEVHNRAALGAFGLLALGTALAVSSLGTGRPETGVTGASSWSCSDGSAVSG